MTQLYPLQCSSCTYGTFKVEHRSCYFFNKPMILFYNLVFSFNTSDTYPPFVQDSLFCSQSTTKGIEKALYIIDLCLSLSHGKKT